MAQSSRTWWGQRFIQAIEQLTDSGRLGRGRSYARNGKIKRFTIQNNRVSARVRGSINPYFGVYKEPLYTTTIEFKIISPAKWSAAIALMASKAGLISRLLLNEIPDNIEESFATLGLHLLPRQRQDFHVACSCPDYSNPCKHIAGVYYRVAAELDQDPFLLFELRGLSRQALQTKLAKTPLGQALSAELSAQEQPPSPVDAYYTRPQTVAAPSLSQRDFWQGEARLPSATEGVTPSVIPAILVKKQGDFPPFWSRDNSFVDVMEELYERIKSKNRNVL